MRKVINNGINFISILLDTETTTNKSWFDVNNIVAGLQCDVILKLE